MTIYEAKPKDGLETLFKDAIVRTCGIDLIKHRSSERSILKV